MSNSAINDGRVGKKQNLSLICGSGSVVERCLALGMEGRAKTSKPLKPLHSPCQVKASRCKQKQNSNIICGSGSVVERCLAL